MHTTANSIAVLILGLTGSLFLFEPDPTTPVPGDTEQRVIAQVEKPSAFAMPPIPEPDLALLPEPEVLSLPETPIEAEEEAPESEKPVPADSLPNTGIYYFHADWCARCPEARINIIEPMQRAGWHILDVDVDKQSDLASQHQISELPTILAIKRGRVADRYSGTQLAPVLQFFNMQPVPRKVVIKSRPVRARQSAIRSIIDGYSGQSWWYRGSGSYRSHLISSHGFSSSQLEGLSDRDLKILHSYAHTRNVSGGSLPSGSTFPTSRPSTNTTYRLPSSSGCPSCRTPQRSYGSRR